ncbi:MAG TPA: hypothetical protein PKD54_09955, partial [Pirellulaceae bacterium]|nr:hypothetical protein [Pirellulaceae bacterium]
MEIPNKSQREPQWDFNPDEPNADILWNSFCYLHDELSDEERAVFERHLADVESVQDAVAEAVVLTDIICCIAPADLAPHSVAPRRPSRVA